MSVPTLTTAFSPSKKWVLYVTLALPINRFTSLTSSFCSISPRGLRIANGMGLPALPPAAKRVS